MMWLALIVLWIVSTLAFAYTAFRAGHALGYHDRGIDMTLPEDSARRYRDTEPRWRE